MNENGQEECGSDRLDPLTKRAVLMLERSLMIVGRGLVSEITDRGQKDNQKISRDEQSGNEYEKFSRHKES